MSTPSHSKEEKDISPEGNVTNNHEKEHDHANNNHENKKQGYPVGLLVFALLSAVVNIALLVLFVVYFFTAQLDQVVVVKSGNRMCKSFPEQVQSPEVKEFCQFVNKLEK